MNLEELNLSELSELPIFSGISKENILNTITELNGYIKNFQNEERIYPYGKQITSAGIILKGRVVLKQIQYNGTEVVLTEFREKKIIGSAGCFIKISYRDLLYYSKGSAQILFLDISKNEKIPQIYRNIIIENLTKIISKNFYQLYKRSLIISQPTLREKIILFFKTYQDECLETPYKLNLTREQLAHYINSDRSALCRELGRMKKDNLIEIDGKNIKLIQKNLNI